MNRCDKYREMISQMLDGELTEPQKTELIAHIAVCRECERLYNAFASISLAIEEGLADPPESLSAGIMDEIRARESSPAASKKPPRKWGRLFALAACLAVVIFAANKSGLFSGAASEPLSAPLSDPVAMDAAAETREAEFGAAEVTETQASGTDDGADEDALITVSPFGDEKSGELTTTGGQDEENATAPSTEQPADSAPPKYEIACEGSSSVDMAITESSVSLMEISAISVYEGDSAEPDPEPIMTITDEQSILLIMDLLEFSEAGDEIDVSGAPIFIFEVERDDGSTYSLSVWIVEGRLCCVSDTDGVLYVAAGDAGDLFAFIANS